MGLDIWFSEDIRNALMAANEASAATTAVIAEILPGQPEEGDDGLIVALRAYREGYKAALTTIALAFGIAPQVVNVRIPPDNSPRKDTFKLIEGE